MLIIKKKTVFKKKATYLPIIKDILEKITDYKLVDFNKLNINTNFKVA